MMFRLIVGLLCLFSLRFSYAQTKSVVSSVNNYRERFPQERVYLQTDKPYYTTGDTLWYKCYLLNSDFLDASSRSGLLYIELISDSGQVVKRQLLPVQGGISWGNFAIDEAAYKEGSYTLRAYTNWMQNFGESSFFCKPIQISNPVSNQWLVSSRSDVNKNSLLLHLELKRINGDELGLRELGLKVIGGGKTVHQNKADTKLGGNLDLDITLPEKPEQLALQVKDLRPGEGNQTLNIPLQLHRPEYTDLQFMPEGGNLVEGISCRVAFKAIGEDGRSADVSGKIVNSKQEQVAIFKSTHAGMGSFQITPQSGEVYTAQLLLNNGLTKSYLLPKVQQTGTTITIENTEVSDSISIKLSKTNQADDRQTYYLTGVSRNVACFAASVHFRGTDIRVKAPKSAFPSGITRFSLLNAQMQPLNERLVYVDQQDALNITLTPSKPKYNIYDSVALHVEVKDKTGKPVQGSFLLSITDDGQVKADTANNILTYLLLTSDLKGEIEDPAYYFNPKNRTTTADLDNLLLTQGWTGFDWKAIFDPKPKIPVYAAEPEYTISGKVTNAFNKPVTKTGVSLLSKKPFIVKDTLTDDAGRFTFRNISPVDTALFFLQARNKSGNSLNVGITVNDFSPSAFTRQANTMYRPWYVNSDTTNLNNAKAVIAKDNEKLKLYGNSRFLKEVKITAKKVIKGSHNLNGPGEADQVIDKEELEKAGKVTLGDLIKMRIRGFNQGTFPRLSSKQSYLIFDKELRLVFDGVDVDNFYTPVLNTNNERLEYINTFLNYYTAEDIKGIEVAYSPKFNSSYRNEYLPDSQTHFNPITHAPAPSTTYIDFAFIEITTRSGHGPSTKITPGTYLYKPAPFNLPKQFYRPRYISKRSKSIPDLRSTIHWEPNVVTDVTGQANSSFYSASKAGTYTIIFQGCNMNGSLGVLVKTIKVAF